MACLAALQVWRRKQGRGWEQGRKGKVLNQPRKQLQRATALKIRSWLSNRRRKKV